MSLTDSAAGNDDDSSRVEHALARGRVEFMGIELLVAPGALVPRIETELLGRAAVEALARLRVEAPRLIDMCCGAGNLACALARHVPAARVWAADLTAACVDLTRQNVAFAGVSDRVSVHQGDLFESVTGLELEDRVDLIVCNPPYISEKRLAEDRRDLLRLEPVEAFAAGAYGLSIHQRVIRDALPFLRAGAALLMEVGAGQQRQVELLLRRAGGYESIESICDDAGVARVVCARRRAD